ncbi:hypothetical protein [Candidatus Pelagisphaera phototrophica]|uniref:hypothetical protein n=1 Tax=Candidatus Pelagisphaera phototrophica TaxID=2684113 RepID=UPI0019EBA5AB|nr:hypothetical protein [Candidatus Pelagisphaera phototrophica]QXD32626.1 hypothetical protein GA004_02575 [Candidatus Pelagisphaera phototrophica]
MKTNTFITLSTATANVGVLVGLVFLIFEIKQNSAIALSQIRQERSLSVIQEYSDYAQDEEFSNLLNRAIRGTDFDSVSDDEWNQLANYELARMTRLEDVFFQHKEGLIDKSIAEFSLGMGATRLPLWKWLRIVSVNPEYTAAVEAHANKSNFEPTLHSSKFVEWAKLNESPIGGIGVQKTF